MKKVIAMILVFAMLVPLSSAVAADEMSAKPTVEEILDEYHRKAFEREMQGDTETASTWSRRGGSAKTLEEETVETLTNAGYEAYNVTAGNYDTLEAQLYTDFGEMGLDPNGSYIVVISGGDGEASGNSAGANSRVRPETDLEGPPGSTGNASFEYTQDGTTYTMRYVTVTSATGMYMAVDSEYDLDPTTWYEKFPSHLMSAGLVAIADSVSEEFMKGKWLPLGSIASFVYDVFADDNYTEYDAGILTIFATTTWTAQSIQVWDNNDGRWETAQSSAMAVSTAFCAGYIVNSTTKKRDQFIGEESAVTTVSPKYTNTSQRLADAVYGFTRGIIYWDRTGDINFYMGDSTGSVVIGPGSQPLFTHQEGWMVPEYD